MRKWSGWAAAVWAAVALAAVPASAAEPLAPAPAPAQNALERYVAAPDPAYGYKLERTVLGKGYRAYVLKLTSQSWRREGEVDRPVWTHWLTIVKPDSVWRDGAMLFIGGGDRGEAAPKQATDRAVRIALDTRSVVAELGQAPNQPLTFPDAPKTPRSEDDLLAYGRARQLATGDAAWSVRLPMVKSAVRAMDAVQEFMLRPEAGSLRLRRFVVAGGAKRGTIAWLTAAIDPRVAAVIPLSADELAAEPVTRRGYEALGHFPPGLKDAVDHRLLPEAVGAPAMAAVRAVEDPFSYRRRPALRMPKFIVAAAGDELLPPDAAGLYWSGLPEEKRLRYVPNTGRGLAGSDALESVIAFYEAVISDAPRPAYSWKKRRDGTLVVRSQTPPREVNLWQAVNPAARDFRFDAIGPAFSKTSLGPGRNGTWVAKPPAPATGYAAYFVELVYDGPNAHPLKFTTEVVVTPAKLPHRWADAQARAAAAPADRAALLKPAQAAPAAP